MNVVPAQPIYRCDRAAARSPPRTLAGPAVMTLAADRRPRVLCVDDDAFLLDICTRTIGVDYEVLTASSGAQALQLIENSEPIQVVISDHRMPGLSGAQFLQAVREKYPLIVRVLLTGETDLVEAVAAMT